VSFEPSQFSYPKGASGTTSDQWMRKVYAEPKDEDDEQQERSKTGEPQVLKAPSPFATVALVASKEGMDRLGQMEMPESPTPKAVEIVIAVGNIALGVAAFQLMLWGMTTLGAAINTHVTARPGREARGERDEEAAA